MAKCKYNGYTLPGVPGTVTEEFAYKVIVYYNDEFFLHCANAPFSVQLIDGAQTIAFPVGSSCYLFGCNLDSTEWAGGLFEPTEGETNDDEWYTIPTYATFIWCYPDICDAGGAVVYEGSAPVPLFDLKSFLTGLSLGLAGKPLPIAPSQKEPVAFLYNGVRLPDIYKVYTPELQKTHPFVFVTYKRVGATYRGSCHALSSIEFAPHPQTGIWAVLCPEDTKAWVFEEWDSVWNETDENNTGGVVFSPIVWANFNLLNEDGTVYLSASEPIPVYE